MTKAEKEVIVRIITLMTVCWGQLSTSVKRDKNPDSESAVSCRNLEAEEAAVLPLVPSGL